MNPDPQTNEESNVVGGAWGWMRGKGTPEGKANRGGQPILELLEPRLLLSADAISADCLTPWERAVDEPAIVIDVCPQRSESQPEGILPTATVDITVLDEESRLQGGPEEGASTSCDPEDSGSDLSDGLAGLIDGDGPIGGDDSVTASPMLEATLGAAEDAAEIESQPSATATVFPDGSAALVPADQRDCASNSEAFPIVIRGPPGYDDTVHYLTVYGTTQDGNNESPISTDQLTGVLDEALALWSKSLTDPDQRNQLHNITVEITDLPEGILGEAQGYTIRLDATAAGHGWFVDSTPGESSEFGIVVDANRLAADSTSAAWGRIDLRTVLLHEIGHVLGFDHDSELAVMGETLSDGARLLLADNSPMLAAPTPVSGAMTQAGYVLSLDVTDTGPITLIIGDDNHNSVPDIWVSGAADPTQDTVYHDITSIEGNDLAEVAVLASSLVVDYSGLGSGSFIADEWDAIAFAGFPILLTEGQTQLPIAGNTLTADSLYFEKNGSNVTVSGTNLQFLLQAGSTRILGISGGSFGLLFNDDGFVGAFRNATVQGPDFGDTFVLTGTVDLDINTTGAATAVGIDLDVPADTYDPADDLVPAVVGGTYIRASLRDFNFTIAGNSLTADSLYFEKNESTVAVSGTNINFLLQAGSTRILGISGGSFGLLFDEQGFVGAVRDATVQGPDFGTTFVLTGTVDLDINTTGVATPVGIDLDVPADTYDPADDLVPAVVGGIYIRASLRDFNFTIAGNSLTAGSLYFEKNESTVAVSGTNINFLLQAGSKRILGISGGSFGLLFNELGFVGAIRNAAVQGPDFGSTFVLTGTVDLDINTTGVPTPVGIDLDVPADTYDPADDLVPAVVGGIYIRANLRDFNFTIAGNSLTAGSLYFEKNESTVTVSGTNINFLLQAGSKRILGISGGSFGLLFNELGFVGAIRNAAVQGPDFGSTFVLTGTVDLDINTTGVPTPVGIDLDVPADTYDPADDLVPAAVGGIYIKASVRGDGGNNKATFAFAGIEFSAQLLSFEYSSGDIAVLGESVGVVVKSGTKELFSGTANFDFAFLASSETFIVNSADFTIAKIEIGSFLTVTSPSVSIDNLVIDSKGLQNGVLTIGAAEISIFQGSPFSVEVEDSNSDGSGIVASVDLTTGAFAMSLDTLTVTLSSYLTLSASGVEVNTDAGNDDFVVSFLSITGTFTAGSFSVSATGRNFGIKGDGTIDVLRDKDTGEPLEFGVSLEFGAGTSGELSWPSWLPIQISKLDLNWPDITADPLDFKILLSATVTDFFGTAATGLQISGGVSNLGIDIGLLADGRFPFTELSGFQVGVKGPLFGAEIDAGLSAGIVKIDKNTFEVLDDSASGDNVEPVFYVAVMGGLSFPGMGGLFARVAFSGRGPLEFYIKADIPILLDYNTGLTLSGLRGGVAFNSTLPTPENAFSLRDKAFAPPGEQDITTWTNLLKQQIASQVEHDVSFDNPLAILTSPMVISAGADLYTTYASPFTFRASVDLSVDTSGKILINASAIFGDTFAAKTYIYGDLSKILSGEARFLFLVDLPEQVGPIPPLYSIFGDISFGFVNGSGSALSGTDLQSEFLTPDKVDSFDGLAGQSSFTLSRTPSALGTVSVKVNGVTTTEFSWIESTLTLDNPLDSDQIVEVTYNVDGQNVSDRTTLTDSASAFKLSALPSDASTIVVKLNGAELDPETDYTVDESSWTVNLASAASAGDEVEVSYGTFDMAPKAVTPPGDYSFRISISGGARFSLPGDLYAQAAGQIVLLFGSEGFRLQISASMEISLFGNLLTVGTAAGEFVVRDMDPSAAFDFQVWGAVQINVGEGLNAFLEPKGISMTGVARLSFNTDDADQTVTLRYPKAGTIPPYADDDLEDITLTLKEQSFSIFVQTQAAISIPGTSTELFSLNGTFFMEISHWRLDVFAAGTMSLGPEGSPLITFDANGLLVVTPDGVAARMSLTFQASSIPGVELGGAFHLTFNTTGERIEFTIPELIDPIPTVTGPKVPFDANDAGATQPYETLVGGVRTIVIPAGAPDLTNWDPADWSPVDDGFYLIVFGGGEINLLDQFTLTGSFQVIAKEEVGGGLSFRLDFNAELNMDPLGRMAAVGTFDVNRQGVVASIDLAFGGTLGDAEGAAPLALSGRFSLEVNTRSTDEQVSRLLLGPDHLPLEGSPTELVDIRAGTVRLFVAGDVQLGAFAQGRGAFLLERVAGLGLTVQWQGSLVLQVEDADLLTFTTDGLLVVQAGGVAGRMSLALSSCLVPGVDFAAAFHVAFNMTGELVKYEVPASFDTVLGPDLATPGATISYEDTTTQPGTRLLVVPAGAPDDWPLDNSSVVRWDSSSTEDYFIVLGGGEVDLLDQFTLTGSFQIVAEVAPAGVSFRLDFSAELDMDPLGSMAAAGTLALSREGLLASIDLVFAGTLGDAEGAAALALSGRFSLEVNTRSTDEEVTRLALGDDHLPLEGSPTELVTIQAGTVRLFVTGDVQLGTFAQGRGAFLLERVAGLGLTVQWQGSLELGVADVDLLTFETNGLLVVQAGGVAGRMSLALSSCVVPGVDFAAAFHVAFNTTGELVEYEVPASFDTVLGPDLATPGATISYEDTTTQPGTRLLVVPAGAPDDWPLDNSSVIRWDSSSTDDYFIVLGGGDIQLLYPFTLTGSFQLNVAQGQDGLQIDLQVDAQLDLGMFGNLQVRGGAVIEDGIFAMRVELGARVINMPGVTISGNFTLEVNTSDTDTKNVDGHDVLPNTCQVAIGAALDFFGVFSAGGGIVIGAENGIFSIQINDLKISFFNIVDIFISGYIKSNGSFNLSGSLDLDLTYEGFGIRGGISATIKNSGISGRGSVSLVVAYQPINLASAVLSVNWQEGTFLIRADAPLGVWLEVTGSDAGWSIRGGIGALDEILDALGDAAVAVGDAVAEAAQAVGNALLDLGQAILDFGADVINFIGGLITDLGALISDVWDAFVGLFKTEKTDVVDLTPYINPLNYYSYSVPQSDGTLTINNIDASKICVAVVGENLIVDAPDITRNVVVAKKYHYHRHWVWSEFRWSSWSLVSEEDIWKPVTFSNMRAFTASGISHIVINGTDMSETIVLDRNSISIDTDVYGRGGDDIIVTGAGNDRVEGGTGDDTIFTYEGNDTLYGQDGNDKLMSGSGDDTVDGGAGNDLIDQSYGASWGAVVSEINALRGGSGNDQILGSLGTDVIEGQGGNDILVGFSDTQIIGGDGDDRIIYDGIGNAPLFGDNADGTGFGADDLKVIGPAPLNCEVHGGPGNDRLENATNADIPLYGDDGNDVLIGGSADDTVLQGGNGDDTIEGRGGLDYAVGGPGNDTYRELLENLVAGETFEGDGDTDGVEIIGTSDSDELRVARQAADQIRVSSYSGDTEVAYLLATSVEELNLDGSAGADAFAVDGSTGLETLSSITIQLGVADASSSDGAADTVFFTLSERVDNLYFTTSAHTFTATWLDSTAKQLTFVITGTSVADNEQLTIYALGGNDVLNAAPAASLAIARVELHAGPGDDVINIGSLAPDAGGNINGIDGVLTVNGEDGSDTLNVDDSGDVSSNTGTLTASSLTGLGMAGGIEYGGMEELNLALGSGDDDFTIESTHTGTTLVDTNEGGDEVAIRAIAGPTMMLTQAGDDVIRVGSAATPASTGTGMLDGIDALLTVNAGAPSASDSLFISDAGNTAAVTGTLTSDTVTISSMPGSIVYEDVENLTISLGSGGNVFTVESTHLGNTAVNSGAGADTVTVLAASGVMTINGETSADVFNVRAINAATSVNGGAGNDIINVGSLAPVMVDGNVDGIQALLTVNGDDDSDTLNVDDTGDMAANDGVLADTELTGLGMSDGIAYYTLEELNIGLGSGADTFTIVSTHSGVTNLSTNDGGDTVNVRTTAGETTVDTGSGYDTINVGSLAPATGGTLNGIAGLVHLLAGSDTDTLNVDDSGDAAANAGEMTAGSIIGLGMGSADQTVVSAELGIRCADFETLNIWLGSGVDGFTVHSTHAALTNIEGGASGDTIRIEDASGMTNIYGGDGDDTIIVDTLISLVTAVTGDTVNLDGQAGSDAYMVNITGFGDYVVNVLDTGTAGETDTLTVYGTAAGDNFLLRASMTPYSEGGIAFVAALHGTPISQVERINYSDALEYLTVDGQGGDDKFTLDDNWAPATVRGGEGADVFQVGQMFRTMRDAAHAKVAVGDEFATTLTTRGYLSNGISYETTIEGNNGNDEFVVFRNLAVLHLFGGDGDNVFTIRAFALEGSHTTTLTGEGGMDYVEYVLNAPVEVVGGDGTDTLRVIGTEFSDQIVVTSAGVFGVNEGVTYAEVERLEIDAAEGNDVFYVLSTAAGVETWLYGGLGSDRFSIAGDVPQIMSGSTEIFPATPGSHRTDAIQGAIHLEGMAGQGSTGGLGDPVMLPGETNTLTPDGPVLGYIGTDLEASIDTMIVLEADLQYLIDASATDSLAALPDFIGLTLEISEGPGLGRFWQILDVQSVASSGTATLLLRSPEMPADEWGLPDTTSSFSITQYSSNFFVEEEEQVDFTTVYNDAATADQSGVLTASTITGLGMGPDGIEYGSLEVLDIFLGSGADAFAISGTMKRDDGFRTVTMVNTGAGDDTVTVTLSDDGGGFLALNTEAGNDSVEASESTLPLIIFGGEGHDIVQGGQGDDIIFGDKGRIDYRDSSGKLITRLGLGLSERTVLQPGETETSENDVPFRQTDGVVRSPILLITLDNDLGDTDTISAGGGNDQVFGGPGGDIISAGGDDDIVIGDAGSIDRSCDPDAPVEPDFGEVVESFLDLVHTIDFAQGDDDWISGHAGRDILIGGTEDDTIDGGDDDDIVLGDQGIVTFVNGKISLVQDPGTTGDDTLSGGPDSDLIIGGLGDDTIDGNPGTDILIGDEADVDYDTDGVTILQINTISRTSGGVDTIYGGSQDDILIGGTNGDNLDGGTDQDLIIGDNVLLALNEGSGDAIDPRFRALTATTIYGPDGLAQVDGEFGDEIQPVPGGRPAWADWTIALDQSLDASHFGNDYVAGGAGNDEIFGQLGNDTIQGDGSIASKVDHDPDTLPVTAARVNGVLQVVASFEDATDGDDYIEGNGGDDVIFGNLGQDDIIGGSSTLFSLTDVVLRDDGSDLIFGGAGTEIARNDPGSPTDGTPAADVHGRDADMILGDNGNILRLVEINGLNSGAYLTFNYDNYGAIRIVPRAAQLLDYSPGGPDYAPNDGATSDIGAADEIHGESGDDFMYGMVGSDVLFGDGQDDDITGGYGNDWFSGGTGQDGIIGDDGRISTGRNGTAEPLYGLAATTQAFISTPGSIQQADIYVIGQLNKVVDLTPFSQEESWDATADEWQGVSKQTSDDIIYGGLGSDFLHGASGDDAISGAEALPEFFDAPINVGGVLGYNPTTGEFADYDEFYPLTEIDGFLLNINALEGPEVADPTWGIVHTDGDDKIFGDLGNDWLVGGTGCDNLYGGWGNDLLNADDDLGTNGGLNDAPDTHPSYEDRAFGGAGRDVLIGNTGGDRLIEWAGEFNSYIVPFAPFGLGTVSRALQPQLAEFLYELSASDGADPTRAADTGADPARNGEPFGELGLVRQQDFAWQDQTGAPDDPQAGNVPGGPRDVLRAANFDNGSTSGFFADSGVWTATGGVLQVAAASKGSDAVSVFHVGDALPGYFEVQASITVVKPTAGWKANSYIIFDYQGEQDFKFAGLDVSINKLVMGHRDATGWYIDEQAAIPGGVKAGKSYNLLLAINGTTATLVMNNTNVFIHTYLPRVVDGYSYGLNWGLVGVGSDNSRGTFDNVRVQVLPPQVTFDSTEDFSDGVVDLFTAESSGVWTVSGGRYHVTPNGVPEMSLIDLGVDSLNVSSYLELNAKVNTAGRAGFIFDRYGDASFKFVMIDALADQVIIGHYTARSGWVIDVVVSKVIDAGTDYTVGVALKGSTVSVTLDGQTVLGHAFNAGVVDGGFGLLATGSPASFDDVRVKTDDQAFSTQTLLASAPPEAAVAGGGTALTAENLDAFVDAAINRLSNAYGLDVGQLAMLELVNVQMADLGGHILGETHGTTIRIDTDAAGYGWFIDSTPLDDVEFAERNGEDLLAVAGSEAFGDMDLLTVVMHEFGHVLGFADLSSALDAGDLMFETLSAGVRRTETRLAVDVTVMPVPVKRQWDHPRDRLIPPSHYRHLRPVHPKNLIPT